MFHACSIRRKVPLALMPFLETHGSGKQKRAVVGSAQVTRAQVRKDEYDKALAAFKAELQGKIEAAKLEQQMKAAQVDKGPAAIAAAVAQTSG